MTSVDYEVVVIGGGFGGLTAARDLREAGHSVLVLEGRDRLGGRTWHRTFGDTSHKVEIGGTWVAPRWQPHVGREIDRYSLELIEGPAISEYQWLLGGERRGGPSPVPVDEWLAFERAIRIIDTVAERIRFGQAPLDQPGLDDLDVPFESWLAALDLPAKSKQLISAWCGFFFGNTPGELSALHVLSWVAGLDNSAIAWYVAVTEKLKDGTGALVQALVDEAGAEIALSSPVDAISSHDDRVEVTTRAGETYVARTAVVATPVNTWHDLKVNPAWTGAKRAIAEERQAGQATKIWALIDNMPGNFFGVGWDTKLNWLATEWNTPDGDLVVGFGVSPETLDVNDHDDVVAAIHEYLPDANVVALDTHDWNADEFSQGTWMAYRPGQVMRCATGIQEPEGRLVFAGSDLAWGWAGWIEGAIESGHRAAQATGRLVSEVAAR